MKKLITSLSVVAVLASLLSLSGTVWSQTGDKKPGKPAAGDARPHRVGLIDMAHVFKHYKKFDAMREDLKEKIAESETKAKQMAEQIKAMQAELKDLKEGSPEFTAKEQKANKLTLDFESFRRATQRDILKEESGIYHTVYMEVADAVKKYSKYYGYTLVLRFNREDLNPEDPQGLIQGMNRQVVYHQQEDDMTESVLQHLNEKFLEGDTGRVEEAKRPVKTPK